MLGHEEIKLLVTLLGSLHHATTTILQVAYKVLFAWFFFCFCQVV